MQPDKITDSKLNIQILDLKSKEAWWWIIEGSIPLRKVI